MFVLSFLFTISSNSFVLSNSVSQLQQQGLHTPKIPAVKCSRCQYEIRLHYCNVCGRPVNDTYSCGECGPVINGGKLVFCVSCGYDLRLNDSPLEPAYGRTTNTAKYTRKSCQMEGWLFKVGSILKVSVVGSKTRTVFFSLLAIF